MNNLWSTKVQSTEILYYSRLERFNDKNCARWFDLLKVKDGMEVLEELVNAGETFDFIFLDSAKGQYYDYIPYLKKLLPKGGVLVTDNVLYKGMVANDDLLILRKKTIVKRLRMYLEAISHDEELETVVIPIGDGVSLTVKK